MSSPNPYQSPVVPDAVEQPGVKYQINFAALSWWEYLRLGDDPLRATFDWLIWKLGLNWSPLPVISTSPPSQMKCDPDDVPVELRDLLSRWHTEAAGLGFRSGRFSLSTNAEGIAVSTELRMLHAGARCYLEICLYLSGRFYRSKINVVSATAAGRILASSNGKRDLARPPTSTLRYLTDQPLSSLCAEHWQWIGAMGEPLRVFETMADMESTMDEIAARFIEFQVARGYWVPQVTIARPGTSAQSATSDR